MNEIEKFVLHFRQKKQDKFLIGIMKTENICIIDEQEYYADDFYISSHLKQQLCTKVNIDDYHSDCSEYLPPLQAGDMVLVYPMNEETFLILDKIEPMEGGG